MAARKAIEISDDDSGEEEAVAAPKKKKAKKVQPKATTGSRSRESGGSRHARSSVCVQQATGEGPSAGMASARAMAARHRVS